MRLARTSSFTFRISVFSRVRKRFLATCCVIVLPPRTNFPFRRSALIASRIAS